MKRFLFVLALALPVAHAQVQTTAVSPALEVQRLAPQLLSFAGSDINFANLVNGLALGVPVTLTTPTAAGGMQVFTFTPSGTLTSLQIAQVLETARQSLIARGIATPTAQQLGAALTGGTLTTAIGSTPLNALVNTATTPTATGGTAPLTQSPANAIQNANSAAVNAAAGSSAVRNTSDSPLPRGVSDTPPLPVPGVTSPAQGATATSEPARVIAPAVPAVAAPGVRAADR